MVTEASQTFARERVTAAIKGLPEFAAATLDALFPSGRENLTNVPLANVRALLRTVAATWGAYAPRGVDRSPEGKPLPPFNARLVIEAITDCVGGTDAETAVRIALNEQLVTEGLGLGKSDLNWRPIERLNPAAVRGVVTSAYFAQRQLQEARPDHTGQLIILANAAPRSANNPDAKGCQFVVALLEGDIFYIGTLNNGVELQGVAPHVKELWHLTIGKEAVGTNGGKAPKDVFRSQHLLPVLESLVNGDCSVIDKRLDVEEEIRPMKDIELDSADSLGNLKTTGSFAGLCETYGLAFGDLVRVTIDDVVHTAKIAKSHGDGEKHELLIVPSSSPKHVSDPQHGGFDIVVNNGRAVDFFSEGKGSPDRVWAGHRVKIERISHSAESKAA